MYSLHNEKIDTSHKIGIILHIKHFLIVMGFYQIN